MTTLREAAQQALEALEGSIAITMAKIALRDAALAALRAALAEPVQEPVKFWPLAPLTGYYDVGGKRVWLEKDEPFPAPPQRKLLTDEEIDRCWYESGGLSLKFARTIERAHGIGGQDEP